MSNKKKAITPSLRASDPFLARERERYENPLPSREMILQVLTDLGVPVTREFLADKLEIAENEFDGFSRRIGAMEREGQVILNRKGDICLVDKLHLVAGRVQGHPDGFGFLIPDDGSADLFLGPKQMHKVLDGDRAMVRQTGVDRRGRPEGTIVEVLERRNEKLVGRLFSEHGVLFVVAENKRISQDILIEPGYDGGAKAGQVVTAQIVVQPSKHSEPVARVIEILGNYADPGMEIEIALRKHDLPYEWSADVVALEKKIPKKVSTKEIQGREDLRALPFVTIDGETARDFDDAVYCEKLSKGLRLLVAIADVSHYVKPGSALDREARLRGNSVYFPRRVIPMLPEALSNEMCSLKPNVDRLALVCDMTLTPAGEVKKYTFYSAVFHSAARFTYTNVAKALYSKEKDHGIAADLLPALKNLDLAFQILLEARHKRGAIDFESIETEMIFNEQGKIENIVPVYRNDAHKLIEECMLAANVCTADFLLKHKHPNLYRVHEGPTPEKLESLRSMLKDFGLQLSGGLTPKAGDYAALLEKVKPRPDVALLQTSMLRSLQQAVYSPDNVGHFGLAYEVYAHFTSPIRRYPDLLTHRAIKAVLAGEVYKPDQPWKDLGIHCSQTERRADEATRDVVAWLKCYYMKDRLGEVFAGTISSVTGFGIFVSLDDVYVEGLVHVSELGQDYFQFDADKHVITGERTRKRYQLADRVNVKVARVDIETSKIDFVLAGERYKEPDKAASEATDVAKTKAAKKTKEPVAPVLTKSKAPGGRIMPPTEVVVTTVTSAAPPVTPMAGLATKTITEKPTAKKTKKSASAGALLTRKK